MTKPHWDFVIRIQPYAPESQVAHSFSHTAEVNLSSANMPALLKKAPEYYLMEPADSYKRSTS